MSSMDGIIVINKVRDFTSHDVVAKLRGILHMKKIGHTGTLDPMATGVLPVAIGKGTGLVELLTEKTKEYRAVVHLGIETDTEDITGEMISQNEVNVSEEEVRSVIHSFLGEQEQIPPMYSALKVNGKKLYELAREGKVVERKPRNVVFHAIDIVDVSLPYVTIDVTCSKGTYIRSLCRDIGEKLGCKACMESLVRTASGSYRLADAHTLAEVSEFMTSGNIEALIIPIEQVLEQYEPLHADSYGDRLLLNGNPITEELVTGRRHEKPVRMYLSDGRFVGLYEWRENKQKYYPRKMFI